MRARPVSPKDTRGYNSDLIQDNVWRGDGRISNPHFIEPIITPDTLAEKMIIPTTTGFDILKRAFLIAQKAFLIKSQKSWPDIYRRSNPEGPHEVRFGRDELRSILRHSWRTTDLGGMGEERRLMGSLYGVTELRNALAHFNGVVTKRLYWYDGLLDGVEKLCKTLDDQLALKEIQGLRDELKCHARQVLEEVESRGLLAELPYAEPWVVHHQRLFASASRALGYERARYSETVLRVAETWDRSGGTSTADFALHWTQFCGSG